MLNALHFPTTGLRKVHFLKLAWFTQVMLKCHTEIMVGTAKNKKQAVTAATPHFQFLFLLFLKHLYACWSYPQCQLRSEGCIMELMSKYYDKIFFPFDKSLFSTAQIFQAATLTDVHMPNLHCFEFCLHCVPTFTRNFVSVITISREIPSKKRQLRFLS